MLVPVDSDENVTTLREFRKLLQSTVGPEGACKLLVTEGGYLELSATSKSLLSRLELENPLCRYIAQVSAGMTDFGLYFAVLVSHLVEQQLIGERIPKLSLQKTMSCISQTVQDLLNSGQVCGKVDFSSIMCLLPLVRTTVTSKCSTLLNNLDLESFCVEVVKLFLNCVNEQTNTVGRVYVKTESGANYISSHVGLLYHITEDSELKIVDGIVSSQIKVLVFTMKLESSDNCSISELLLVLEKAITLNVKVVACQKTVCSEVKLFLSRKNILLLERMGTDLTTELVHMSQAFPVSQLHVGLLDEAAVFGNLSEIKLLQFNDNDYVLLRSEDVTVGTLLVQSCSLAGTDHLKVLAQQAIGALKSLALQPFLTPGGGCLEVWLIAQLSTLKESTADKETIRVVSWVQRALLSGCGALPPCAVDSEYHHGWAGEVEARCQCGLVTRDHVEQKNGRLIFLSETLGETLRLRLSPPRLPPATFRSDTLVHCHQIKANVILSALETFVNLSDIGVIINND